MSSILKALEKVDESQRRRPAGTGGLPKGRGRRPAWLIPAWALGGAAVATLATYAMMGGFSGQPAQVARKGGDTVATSAAVAAPAAKETVAAKPAAGPVAKAAAQTAARPATGTVAEKPLQPVARGAAKPVTQSAARATVNAVAPPQASVQAAGKQLSRPTKASAPPVAPSQPAAAFQAAVQPEPAVAAQAPATAPAVQQKSRPEIRVTGIAWQNNGESSFAMVNGRPMRQGSTVEGYKLEQIYEDSVRFTSSKGASLVVPLGAGEE